MDPQMDPQIMELLMAILGGQGANAGMGQAAGMMPPGMAPQAPGQPGMMDQLMQILGGQQPQAMPQQGIEAPMGFGQYGGRTTSPLTPKQHMEQPQMLPVAPQQRPQIPEQYMQYMQQPQKKEFETW